MDRRRRKVVAANKSPTTGGANQTLARCRRSAIPAQGPLPGGVTRALARVGRLDHEQDSEQEHDRDHWLQRSGGSATSS